MRGNWMPLLIGVLIGWLVVPTLLSLVGRAKK
jgi:hypothetical protein